MYEGAAGCLKAGLGTIKSPEVGFWGSWQFLGPSSLYFRHVTDRRSEKKLGLKLALMGKSTGDLVQSAGGSFSSI